MTRQRRHPGQRNPTAEHSGDRLITPRHWRTPAGTVPIEQRRVSMPTAAARDTLIALVWLYRLTLSPLLGGQCRHVPTCSEYAIRVLHERGPWLGALLSARRVLSCHPFARASHPGASGERTRADQPARNRST